MTNKVTIRDLCLIVDDREKNLYPHLELEATEINYMKKRINVGDYALVNMRTGEIIAVFERKSLKDFGASFKDGRYLNKESMLELRRKTNCRVIYIVEGPANPQPNATFSRVPYSRIESAIFHMMIRDQIIPMHTTNTQNTIVKLIRFIKSMVTLLNKETLDFKPCSDFMQPSGNVTSETSDNVVTDGSSEGVTDVSDVSDVTKVTKVTSSFNYDDSSAPQFVIPEGLTAKITKSDIDIVREMWACFSGVSVINADNFITKMSINDIIRGKISAKEISEIKTPSGVSISRHIIKSFTKMATSGDTAIEARLLSKIPGISLASAKSILESTSLRQLLSYEPGAISIFKVGKARRNLGTAKAERILKYFNFIHEVKNPSEYYSPAVTVIPSATSATSQDVPSAASTTVVPTSELISANSLSAAAAFLKSI